MADVVVDIDELVEVVGVVVVGVVVVGVVVVVVEGLVARYTPTPAATIRIMITIPTTVVDIAR